MCEITCQYMSQLSKFAKIVESSPPPSVRLFVSFFFAGVSTVGHTFYKHMFQLVPEARKLLLGSLEMGQWLMDFLRMEESNVFLAGDDFHLFF